MCNCTGKNSPLSEAFCKRWLGNLIQILKFTFGLYFNIIPSDSSLLKPSFIMMIDQLPYGNKYDWLFVTDKDKSTVQYVCLPG